MKFKKFLCAFVCVFILLGGIVFASCGKKHYNMANFATDYGSGSYSAISFKSGKYVFNFEDISSTAYQGELDEIATINQNLTAFLAETVTLSGQKGNVGISDGNRDRVKNYLSAMKQSLAEADKKLEVFKFLSGNAASQPIEQQRESLKSAYNSLNDAIYRYFVAISNLSQVYANIYFSNYMSAENVNYYKQYVENKVNIEVLSNQFIFNARVAYQIFSTSQVYLIQNFRIAAQNNVEEFNLYKSTVESLNACKLDGSKKFSDTEKTKLLAVQYYNGFALLHNDYNAFVSARDTILNATDTGFEYDNSLFIVENYKSKINELNGVLIALHNQLA